MADTESTPDELRAGPCCDLEDRDFYLGSQRLLDALEWDGFLTTSREHQGLICQVAYSQPNPFLRPRGEPCQ